jgi:pimeloyl-ACP methyl ester carboxylesterase
LHLFETMENSLQERPAVVLVHGAFADGTGWKNVIPLLEAKGFDVTAVQNPLTSLADDIAATRRVVKSQKGPVILVGHSYGGAVITAAAAGMSQVKALVYIAAFAPEVGETLSRLLNSMAPSDIGPALVPDAGGFLSIDRGKFHSVFCRDLSADEGHIMAVAQKPIAGPIFDTQCPEAAWKSIPSWYLVAAEDHAINPDLERFFAKRMKAATSEVKASHVAFLSQPKAAVDVIEAAARATVLKQKVA